MRRELLHTPEGVRDIYNGECDKKQRIEQELHQTFLSLSDFIKYILYRKRLLYGISTKQAFS